MVLIISLRQKPKDIISDLNQQINLLTELLRTVKNPKQLVIIETDLKSFKAIKNLVEQGRSK